MFVVCFDLHLLMVSGPFLLDALQSSTISMRLLVNIFQAKVALGQWVDQPFMPSIDVLAEAIRSKHPKLEEPLNVVRVHPWLQSRLSDE
jgi:hypothetical protein